jgi:hypothetical protein
MYDKNWDGIKWITFDKHYFNPTTNSIHFIKTIRNSNILKIVFYGNLS